MITHRYRFKYFFLITIILSFVSCAHLPLDPAYSGPDLLPQAVKESFGYRPYDGAFHSEVLYSKKKYDFKKISFDSGNNTFTDNKKITLEYFDVKGEEKTPVILILPILSGNGNIEKNFAKYYAENGYSAIIVNQKKRYFKKHNFNEINHVLKDIVINHRLVIDWIGTQEDLDPQNIGMFGISMGGIKSALISPIDNRIKASIIALAGGDLPYILTHSKEGSVKRKREEYLKNNHISPTAFYNELNHRITCDPLNYASYQDARNTMMILALFDACVPIKKGKELKSRMGNPETIYLFSGHYTSIFYQGYVKRVTLNFFNKKLD